MNNILIDYNENGWVGPLVVLNENEAKVFEKELKILDKKYDLMNSDYRCKSNVLFPLIYNLCKNTNIIHYVKQLIGDNFHAWDSMLWFKKAKDQKIVSFHQDATYWNFDKKYKALTVWYAVTDSFSDSGGIQYVTGSHKLNQQIHNDIKVDNNLLMRGQTVDYTVSVVDQPDVHQGECLIHSPFIIHGSKENKSKQDRLAVGMMFVSTECKPLATYSPESTIMMSGTDNHNHMIHDPIPTGNWDTDRINWKLAYDRQHDNYYKMSVNGYYY